MTTEHKHSALDRAKEFLGEIEQRPLDYAEGLVYDLVEQFDTLRRAVEAWDATLSSYCDGPERDAVRAALSNPAKRPPS